MQENGKEKSLSGNNGSNKSRKMVLCTIIIVVLVLLIVGTVLFFKSKENARKEMELLLQNRISETLIVSEDDISVEESQNTTADKIFNAMTYKVTEIQPSSCTVTVNAPDMNALFFSVFDVEEYSLSNSMEDYEQKVDSINQQIDKKLSEGDYDTITISVTVPLNENGEPELTYELADALYGGLLSLQETLFENYVSEMGSD